MSTIGSVTKAIRNTFSKKLLQHMEEVNPAEFSRLFTTPESITNLRKLVSVISPKRLEDVVFDNVAGYKEANSVGSYNYYNKHADKIGISPYNQFYEPSTIAHELRHRDVLAKGIESPITTIGGENKYFKNNKIINPQDGGYGALPENKSYWDKVYNPDVVSSVSDPDEVDATIHAIAASIKSDLYPPKKYKDINLNAWNKLAQDVKKYYGRSLSVIGMSGIGMSRTGESVDA